MAGDTKPPASRKAALPERQPAPLEPLSTGPKERPSLAPVLDHQWTTLLWHVVGVTRFEHRQVDEDTLRVLEESLLDEMDVTAFRIEESVGKSLRGQQKQIDELRAMFGTRMASNPYVNPHLLLDQPPVAELASENLRQKVRDLSEAAGDVVDRHACYASLRTSVAKERDRVHAAATDRMREFAIGLIYDAMGWTEALEINATALHELARAVDLASAPTVSDEDFMNVREILEAGGFEVAPPPLPDEEERDDEVEAEPV